MISKTLLLIIILSVLLLGFVWYANMNKENYGQDQEEQQKLWASKILGAKIAG